jgi:hypothetical protein
MLINWADLFPNITINRTLNFDDDVIQPELVAVHYLFEVICLLQLKAWNWSNAENKFKRFRQLLFYLWKQENMKKARKWEMEERKAFGFLKYTQRERARNFFHPFVVMDLFCHKFALFKAKGKTFRAFFIIVRA